MNKASGQSVPANPVAAISDRSGSVNVSEAIEVTGGSVDCAHNAAADIVTALNRLIEALAPVMSEEPADSGFDAVKRDNFNPECQMADSVLMISNSGFDLADRLFACKCFIDDITSKLRIR